MVLFLFVIIAAAMLSACSPVEDPVSFDEVARVASPDGRAEALLVETNGGATTSFGYYVFVVPKGVKLESRDDKYIVAKLYGAVRNEQAFGVNLKWPDKTHLSIEYLYARSSELLVPSINFAAYDVKVVLNKGIADPSAPAGGMLFNREKSSKGN